MYSYVGDVVLDPFTGTGTTLKVAREMGRNAVGYEIDLELKDVIRERIPVSTLFGEEKVEFLEREDAKRLSSNMRAKINEKLENKKVS